MRADRKYTDRDVRENDNLVEMAIDFVENYQGDFEFLVDCKMRIAHGGELSVGMVRGILNCMRANPRVKHLPDPLPVVEGEVITFQPRTYGRSKTRRGHSKCEVTEPHEYHEVEKGEYEWKGYCSGVYLINRDYEIYTKAWINRPYVAAVSVTSMLHKTWDGDSRDPSRIRWFPRQHGVGFLKSELLVAPLCTKPQKIKNPLLLTEAEAQALQSSNEPRPYCSRCFDVS